MAITVQQLIQRAYRENNLIPIGKEPTTAEITESHSVYQSLVDGWYGGPLSILLQDWEAQPNPTSLNPSRFPLYPEPNAYVPPDVWKNPPANVRLVANLDAASTVYFFPTPPDGARMALINVGTSFATRPLTLAGNGRKIEGADNVVLTTDPTGPLQWFYRADLGNWVLVEPLELADEIPFDPQFTDFQVAALALRRAPTYNKTVNDLTLKAYMEGLQLLKTRYYQSQAAATFPGAWRFNTFQTYPFGGPGGAFY